MDICKDLPRGVDLSNLWQSKISYARDFLLSFSELEVCKRLPSGFNPSMLCESLDASGSIFDMQKTIGEKEDIHSSGWNNTDCHSQGNWVLDNGRDHGGHSQYSRQNIVFVYNGLLGSGTSSKISHGTAGAMAPMVQANGNYQLSKSDNPYRPPRSSKVVPKAVRKFDSYIERTSSSAECMIVERTEEEKPEGAYFHLIRKREQKALQDKQKQIGDKHGMLLSQDSPNDVRLNKSEECMTSSHLNENSAKSSTSAQNSVSRTHLGIADFASKNLGIKSLTHPCKFKPRERCDVEADKTHRPIFHTKNFADWFVEEGKKKGGGCSSLSTKGSSEVYGTANRLVTEHKIATFSSYRNALMCKLTTSTLPSAEHGASKSTASHEVLTCKLKQSTLSDDNKNTATQHHFAPRLGTHGVGNQQLHSENQDGASLYFSSFSQKGVTSSKHKMSSLHENFLPIESDCCVAHVLTKGNSKTHKKSQAFEPNFGIGFAKEVESALRGSLEGVSRPVVSNPGGFPSSVADDNFLISIADEYRSTGTNFEGGRAANLAEITELANTEVNQSTFDDDWAEILSMLIIEQESDLSAIYYGRCQMSDSTVQIKLPDEDSLITIDDLLSPPQLPKSTPETAPKLQREQESKLIPIAGCNESALECCLPDEESFITFDDLIIPHQQLVSMSAVSSGIDHTLPSNVTVDGLGKLPGQNVVKQNERSTVPGYYGAMNLGDSFHSQCTQQSYPHFYCSLINMGKPSLDALASHEAQMNTQTRPMNPRTTSSTPPLKQHFKVQSLASGRTTKPKRPIPHVCYSLLQKQAVFPPCQQNEPLRGPTDYLHDSNDFSCTRLKPHANIAPNLPTT